MDGKSSVAATHAALLGGGESKRKCDRDILRLRLK